jgi:hypothetical protein
MAPPPIRIRFRRSGGFAGIPLTAATTADQLAGDHAAQVQRLLTLTGVADRLTLTDVPGELLGDS